MTYTPINWQNGDTITAEKMNKMDNGWGVESTQLFNETVTTSDEGGINYGVLLYASQIESPTIIVTFNGTSYTCDATEEDGVYLYGAPFGEQGPDFSDFPFAIESTTEGNNLYTETAGANTLAVVGASLQTSADFTAAVSSIVGGAFYPLVLGETTWRQVVNAMAAGKLVFRSWANDYDDNATDDTQYAGIELVTEAYIDARGDYRVSAIVVEKEVQSIASYSAATADEGLTY